MSLFTLIEQFTFIRTGYLWLMPIIIILFFYQTGANSYANSVVSVVRAARPRGTWVESWISAGSVHPATGLYDRRGESGSAWLWSAPVAQAPTSTAAPGGSVSEKLGRDLWISLPRSELARGRVHDGSRWIRDRGGLGNKHSG